MRTGDLIFMGCLIGSTILFFIGMVVGNNAAHDVDKISAIQHQAAHYDLKTGAFTWNQEEQK